MRCPYCKGRVKRRTCDATGRWYLYCPSCKETLGLINDKGSWLDRTCCHCNSRTMRHDVTDEFYICRACNGVTLREKQCGKK